jgi:glycerate dehydrogenase
MTKIVVTSNQDFTDTQKQRLEGLGEVKYYDSQPSGAEEYLERVKGADIICSGTAGLQDAYPELHDVFITVSFVSVAFVDVAVLKQHNVTISNAPGANRHAVAEWAIAMMILLTRDLWRYLDDQDVARHDGLPPLTQGLAGRKLTIIGAGNVGGRIAEVAEALGMTVGFFRRGDDLLASVKDADIVVNTLSVNPSTANLLGTDFFAAMKAGSYFVNVARAETIDTEALLRVLDDGHLGGVATDCSNVQVGDTSDPYYQQLVAHPKVLATPHIAYASEMSRQTGTDMLIDNVEAWINGAPIHVVEP